MLHYLKSCIIIRIIKEKTFAKGRIVMKMMYLTPVASILALLFVAYTARKVLAFSKGNQRMARVPI